MTFKELFLIKSPCNKCIVQASCKQSLKCGKNMDFLKLSHRRFMFWQVNYSKLIYAFVMLGLVACLIIIALGRI